MHARGGHRLCTPGGRIRTVLQLIALAGLVTRAAGIARAQDSPHGNLALPCEECHSADSWKVMPEPARFDHRKTGFPLKGRHTLAQCMNCHTSLTFTMSSTRCADCHDDVHYGELGAACDRCHSPQSWLVPDMAQRHASTRFSLVGAHATVPCQQCHTSQQKNEYVGLRTDCYGCHASDFDGAQSPNHRQAGLGTDCQTCHAVNAMNWGGTFDHSRTGFPLLGAHATIACAQCHAGNVFRASGTQCISCHGQQFATANAPPHAGFPAYCATCHSLSAWQPATFDHNKSVFPLAGAHAAVPCQQCHASNVFAGLSTACYSCHQQQFATANAPSHTGFPTDCTTCHTTSAWQPATFNHSSTPFPLTGGHTTVACAQCHVNNVFAGLTTDCYACHTAQFTSATAPVPHTGFPAACASCHTTNPGWQPSTYSHSGVTPHFPTDSRHTSAACAKCHQTATNYTQYCCQSSGCHNGCQGGG
jgi:hypothetical protein